VRMARALVLTEPQGIHGDAVRCERPHVLQNVVGENFPFFVANLIQQIDQYKGVDAAVGMIGGDDERAFNRSESFKIVHR